MTLTTAQPFSAPTVKSLSVRLVVDSYFDQFMPKATHPLCRIEHVSRIPGREQESTIAGEWGLSLHLASESNAGKGQYLLDFGYTPEILLRNFDLLGIAPEKLDGLILSHAHRGLTSPRRAARFCRDNGELAMALTTAEPFRAPIVRSRSRNDIIRVFWGRDER